jgi:hypothetical protein
VVIVGGVEDAVAALRAEGLDVRGLTAGLPVVLPEPAESGWAAIRTTPTRAAGWFAMAPSSDSAAPSVSPPPSLDRERARPRATAHWPMAV